MTTIVITYSKCWRPVLKFFEIAGRYFVLVVLSPFILMIWLSELHIRFKERDVP